VRKNLESNGYNASSGFLPLLGPKIPAPKVPVHQGGLPQCQLLIENSAARLSIEKNAKKMGAHESLGKKSAKHLPKPRYNILSLVQTFVHGSSDDPYLWVLAQNVAHALGSCNQV
jgi:hypothetical protein